MHGWAHPPACAGGRRASDCGQRTAREYTYRISCPALSEAQRRLCLLAGMPCALSPRRMLYTQKACPHSYTHATSHRITPVAWSSGNTEPHFGSITFGSAIKFASSYATITHFSIFLLISPSTTARSARMPCIRSSNDTK